RVTVADKILAGRLRLTGSMAIEGGGGTITFDAGGLRAEKNGTTTFEISAEGDAFFGGTLAAGIVTGDTVVPGTLSDLKTYDFRSEIATISPSFVDMPDMNITYTVTKPGRLLVMVAAPVMGYATSTWYVFPQTRLLIDGEVVQSDPDPPAPSGELDRWYERILRTSVPGTYYFQRDYLDPNVLPVNINVRVQWRSARAEGVAPAVRHVFNKGRGMAFILLK